MANTKKKTVKADKEESTVKEPVVTETAEAVKAEEVTGAQEEVKEEKEPEAKAAGEAQVEEEAAGTEEPVRKKRKYTKKATKETKTEKTTAKKTKKDSKEVENIQEVYLEFGDNKILSEEVIENIKQAYKAEGHRISSIKKLQVYMNLDEKKAYYVINDKAEGKFVEF
ncbi:MAG: hypothetical protein HFH68_03110 [Lachnospiraceae bacterium]|nr:hypothetical protein [Lachnospiraceae bacterium]